MKSAPNKKTAIFESAPVPKALAIMAIPMVLSQVIILAYNLADTHFIGRADNPFMVGAVSLVLGLYLMLVAIANLFGVGGGNLMVRLLGINDEEEARKVCSYSIMFALIVSIVFSLLCLALSEPLLRMLGANDNTLGYAKEYLICTIVIGGVPTVLAMAMPMLLRSVGYSKEAGLGVIIGGVLNIVLDPLFMFVILPDGKQVLGAGLATMISNFVAAIYFIVMFIVLRKKSVLTLPTRFEKLRKESLVSFYTVGIPAALIMIFFNLLAVVLNRLASSYDEITLAAAGILLKVERIPQNITLGVCLAMVPCIGYNYARKNSKRMDRFFVAAMVCVLTISIISGIIFAAIPEQIVRLFIKNAETVALGAKFLRTRSISIPFMAVGFLVINYTQAVNRGKVSFLLSIIRHIALSIPMMLIFNWIWGIDGLMWSQTVADVINVGISLSIFFVTRKKIMTREMMAKNEEKQ